MAMIGPRGTWIAALVLGAGLLGSGGLAAGAAPAAQQTPAAQTVAAADQCQADEEDEIGKNAAEDQDDVQDENGADDAAEGDTDAAGFQDEGSEKENSEDRTDDDGAAAKPGELSEGQNLLPRATITVEQAVKAAQAEATGALGSVELEEKGGKLVFEVTVGDQEVFVDAADGSIASVEPVHSGDDDGCDDDGDDGKPGELADGRDLLPQAGITVEAAVAAAQAAAPGAVGEVDLERIDGTLVFVVDVGDANVRVDAATGAVVGTEQED